MLDVLTNPITLLCLGIVFLLISLLFFYFKRTISILEKAQMEQAHILQSFISNNMEMSRPIPYQQMNQHGALSFNNRTYPINDDFISVTDDGNEDNNAKSVNYDNIVMGIGSKNDEIVTDTDGDTDEDSEDEDSEDEDADDEDADGDCGSDNGNVNDSGGLEEGEENENSSTMNHRVNLNMLGDSIKVIQLVDEELLEINRDIQRRNNTSLEDFDKNINSILHSVSVSVSGSDSDSEYDSDDSDQEVESSVGRDSVNSIKKESNSSTSMNLGNNILHSLENSTPTNKQPIHSSPATTGSPHPIFDIKSLNVQSLRQMAENKQLVQIGEKKSKKELIKLLESNKQ